MMLWEVLKKLVENKFQKTLYQVIITSTWNTSEIKVVACILKAEN